MSWRTNSEFVPAVKLPSCDNQMCFSGTSHQADTDIINLGEVVGELLRMDTQSTKSIGDLAKAGGNKWCHGYDMFFKRVNGEKLTTRSPSIPPVPSFTATKPVLSASSSLSTATESAVLKKKKQRRKRGAAVERLLRKRVDEVMKMPCPIHFPMASND